MIRFFLVPCVILMLGIRVPMAEEMQGGEGSLEGAKGLGIGALVGGLVGGPVGALVGAAGGAFFAEQNAEKDRSIDDLEVKLDSRTSELAVLKSDLEQTQVAMTGDMPVIAHEPDVPLSLAVYFRTDDASVEASLERHLVQLGARSVLEKEDRDNLQLLGSVRARGGLPILAHPSDPRRPWHGPMHR